MSRAYDQLRNSLRSNPQRWLVTGAAGFIGSALVHELCRLGQFVVGLDNLSTGHKSNISDIPLRYGGSFQFIEGDIRDPELCSRACQDVDYVLHQAALGSVPRSLLNPQATHDNNVNGTINVFLAAREVKRIVYASSSSVYGDATQLPKIESEIGKPLSPYAASKRICEIYADVFHQHYALPIIGLRYFNVFGRRQDPEGAYAAAIPRWINLLLQKQQCTIFGDGKTSRDFCYIDNVIQANLLAATSDNPQAINQVFNVGCNGQTTLNQLYSIIRDGLADLGLVSQDIAPRYQEERAGDVRYSWASIDKISNAVGYKPTHDIRAGLQETIAWFAEAATKHSQVSNPSFTRPAVNAPVLVPATVSTPQQLQSAPTPSTIQKTR